MPVANVPAANLAVNGGFERPAGQRDIMPEDWFSFASDSLRIFVTDEIARSGRQALKMEAQGKAEAYMGIIARFPVKAGRSYAMEAYFRRNRDNSLGGTARVQIVIEWLDADGNELKRDESRTFGQNLSAMRWERRTLMGKTAPPGATEAVFGIHLNDGDDGGRGSLFIDDCAIFEY
jgi:hypothetical protein